MRIPVNGGHDVEMFVPLLWERLHAADVGLCVSGDPNVSGSQVGGSINSLGSPPSSLPTPSSLLSSVQALHTALLLRGWFFLFFSRGSIVKTRDSNGME